MPIEQRTPTDRTLTGKQRLPQVMHDHVFGMGSILPMEDGRTLRATLSSFGSSLRRSLAGSRFNRFRKGI